jgi:hypothetical protein
MVVLTMSLIRHADSVTNALPRNLKVSRALFMKASTATAETPPGTGDRGPIAILEQWVPSRNAMGALRDCNGSRPAYEVKGGKLLRRELIERGGTSKLGLAGRLAAWPVNALFQVRLLPSRPRACLPTGGCPCRLAPQRFFVTNPHE